MAFNLWILSLPPANGRARVRSVTFANNVSDRATVRRPIPPRAVFCRFAVESIVGVRVGRRTTKVVVSTAHYSFYFMRLSARRKIFFLYGNQSPNQLLHQQVWDKTRDALCLKPMIKLSKSGNRAGFEQMQHTKAPLSPMAQIRVCLNHQNCFTLDLADTLADVPSLLHFVYPAMCSKAFF